jgi:hypothetical protein
MNDTDPPRCAVCGDTLSDYTLPGTTTCKEWADSLARLKGDMLDEATHTDRWYVAEVRKDFEEFMRWGEASDPTRAARWLEWFDEAVAEHGWPRKADSPFALQRWE